MLSNYTTSTYFLLLTKIALFIFFKKAFIFYYFLLPFCKRLWYNIFKFCENFYGKFYGERFICRKQS